MTFAIVHLLPELLGTYGDRGNVEILSWRLKQREVAHELLTRRGDAPLALLAEVAPVNLRDLLLAVALLARVVEELL